MTLAAPVLSLYFTFWFCFLTTSFSRRSDGFLPHPYHPCMLYFPTFQHRIHGTNGLFTYIDPIEKSTIHVGFHIPFVPWILWIHGLIFLHSAPGNCGFRQEIDSLEHARDLTAQKSVASENFSPKFPQRFFIVSR